MKSVLFIILALLILGSCKKYEGIGRIVFPSNFGTPFDYGAIVYAVNITRPELTRRIRFLNADNSVESELAAGEYVFQAIGAYEDTGVKFTCAQNLNVITVTDGSFHDVDLAFSTINCVNQPVFLNKNATRFLSVTGNIDSILRFDYCQSAGTYTPANYLSTCNETPAQSLRFEYIADSGAGISFCTNIPGNLTTNHPAILGNATIYPAGQVFAQRISAYNNPNCDPPLVRVFDFPLGLDALPTSGGKVKLEVEGNMSANVYLGFF